MAKARKAETTAPQWPAASVEMWPLDKIVEYPNNPRTHSDEQIDLLAKAMMEEGVTAPILVDEDGVIIYGHGRRRAGLKNSFKEYPVVIARGWTDERKRAVRIRDNSIASLSGWNKELIQGEIGWLKTAGYDIPLLGFPEATLRGWGVTLGTDGADPEATPDIPKVVVVKPGDLWLLGEHRLLCGDSTKAEDVAKVLGKAKPNLMVTDSPYGVEYDANWRNEAAAKGSIGYGASAVAKVSNDDVVDWTKAWKLFGGNIAYCWHADRHASEVQRNLEAAKFEIVSQIIWAKPRFVISRGDYHWQHEPCWYAVRKGAKHQWNGGR